MFDNESDATAVTSTASEPARNALSQLQFTTSVAKRAQYEAFEFTIESAGVRVRNGSYADPENHEYLVTVSGGVPQQCTCPADARFDGACKHRVAVAIRAPILRAATMQVAADGGSEAVGNAELNTDVDDGFTDGGCADCLQLEGFPCWECVRTGKRTIPK